MLANGSSTRVSHSCLLLRSLKDAGDNGSHVHIIYTNRELKSTLHCDSWCCFRICESVVEIPQTLGQWGAEFWSKLPHAACQYFLAVKFCTGLVEGTDDLPTLFSSIGDTFVGRGCKILGSMLFLL